jgi:predicted metal-binding protein
MKSEKNPSSLLEEAESPVNSALILICEKCGKKLIDSDDSEKNPSRLIQKEMKSLIAEEIGKKEMRALVTTCMNICPKGKIATCLVPTGKNADAPKFYEADLDDLDCETAARSLLKELQQELG